MKRTLVVTAAAVALAPAISGLTANPSLSREVRVRVVGQAADGVAAVAVATELGPDVALMDLSMPGTDGVTATRELLAVRPGTHVVVQASYSDHDRVAAALAAGAVGYLLKDWEPDELLVAVRAAAQGSTPLDPRVAGALLPSAVARPVDRLGARGREVLRLWRGGW